MNSNFAKGANNNYQWKHLKMLVLINTVSLLDLSAFRGPS